MYCKQSVITGNALQIKKGWGRLSETDWNHLPIFDHFCALLDQIPYFTKAETLQNTSKTPESLDTKGQKVGIYFGTSKNEHKYRCKALKSSRKRGFHG